MIHSCLSQQLVAITPSPRMPEITSATTEFEILAHNNAVSRLIVLGHDDANDWDDWQD